MTKARVLLSLCLLITLLVTSAVLLRVIQSKSKDHIEFTVFRNASKLNIGIQGRDLELLKTNGVWTVQRFNNESVKDSRANQSLIEHLLDIVALYRIEKSPRYSFEHASDYGMHNPALSLAVGWEVADHPSELLVFGRTDLSGHKVFMLLPRRELLTEVGTTILELIPQNSIEAFRDRHITTFQSDDVEDVLTTDGCGAFVLWRDGDTWRWKSPKKPTLPAEDWVKNITDTLYDEINETTDLNHARELCRVELRGRKSRSEILSVWHAADGGLWIKNSALPSLYRVPKQFAKLLNVKLVKTTAVQ